MTKIDREKILSVTILKKRHPLDVFDNTKSESERKKAFNDFMDNCKDKAMDFKKKQHLYK
jgi:hypothetical protein